MRKQEVQAFSGMFKWRGGQTLGQTITYWLLNSNSSSSVVTTPLAKFNIQLFEDIGTTELYQTTLQNRFQALQEEEEKPVEEHWNSLKNIWKEACPEVVGKKQTKQNLVVYWNTEKNRREEGKKGYPKQMQNLSKKGSSPQKRD